MLEAARGGVIDRLRDLDENIVRPFNPNSIVGWRLVGGICNLVRTYSSWNVASHRQ